MLGIENGHACLYSLDASGEPFEPLVWQKNLALYEATKAWAQLWGSKNGLYGIGAMYIEYVNNSVAGSVPIPSFDRTPPSGSPYYASLAGLRYNDYLRVPVGVPALDSTDPSNFPQGNRLTFRGNSGGQTTGVSGKPFDQAHQSVVFGGALVSTPSFADPTQDVVIARFYTTLSKQIPNTSQPGGIGLAWQFQWVPAG